MRPFTDRSVSRILLVIATLLWAGNFIVGRGIRSEFQPITLNFWRWSIACLILVPFAWRDVFRHKEVLLANWKVLLALGATGIASHNSLLYQGLRETDAINASLLLSLSPMVILATSVCLLGTPVNLRQLTGVCISFLGAVMLLLQGDLEKLEELVFNTGDLWILGAVVIWSSYTILLSRLTGPLEPRLVQLVTVVLGVFMLLPFYAWEQTDGPVWTFSTKGLLAVVYVSLFASVIAYVLWNRAVARLGPVEAGQFLHLIPVFCILLSTPILGEAPSVYHLSGAACILGGIWLTRGSMSRPKVSSTAKGRPR